MVVGNEFIVFVCYMAVVVPFSVFTVINLYLDLKREKESEE